MPAIEGIHHIGFSAADIERSAVWYRDVLGFETLRVMEDRVLLRHPGSGVVLGVVHHGDSAGGKFDEMRTGLDHVAFTVAGRAQLEEWLQRFEEQGVDHSPIKEGGTGSLITFRDPDNVQLEVYSRTK